MEASLPLEETEPSPLSCWLCVSQRAESQQSDRLGQSEPRMSPGRNHSMLIILGHSISWYSAHSPHPSGTFEMSGDILLFQLGCYYRCLVDRGKDAAKHPKNAQDNPQQQWIVWSNISITLRLKNLVLECGTPQELLQSPSWGESRKGKNVDNENNLKVSSRTLPDLCQGFQDRRVE